MTRMVNGMSASQLQGVTWQKSARSNPSGNCVECAALPGGGLTSKGRGHQLGEHWRRHGACSEHHNGHDVHGH